MAEIRFYSTRDEYGFLPNFSRHKFRIGERIYPSSEHYYQSKKFEGTDYEMPIIRASSPALAAKMGRDRKKPLRKDWILVRDQIMYEAIEAKFRQNPDIKEKLLATGDAVLIEASPIDYYWGEGSNKKGKNKLGKLLMRLREQFRQEKLSMEEAEHLSDSGAWL